MEESTYFQRRGNGTPVTRPISTVWAALLPRSVVDGVLVGGAGHGHVPLHRPGVGVLEALAGVGLRGGVKQAPGLHRTLRGMDT